MWTILRQEIHSLLDSLMAYVVMAAFLMSMGLLLWFFPQTSFLEYGYAEMGAFFGICPYVLICLVPAISMRSYVEEKRSGTLELLLTSPVSITEVVLGKFLASVGLLALCLLPTLLYYASLYALGHPIGNIDSAEVMGSYAGLLLVGACFCAIGQSSSACCENQLVAFVLSSFVCFVFYFALSALAEIDIWGWKGEYASMISLSHHYDSLSKGLIELKELVFFLGFISFFLLLTAQLLRNR